MSFLSFTTMLFLIFLAVFTVIYYMTPLRFRWLVLLAASTVFYLSAGIEKMPFILITSLLVFLSARQINKTFDALEQEADEKQLTGKKRMDFLAPVKKKCRNYYLIPTIVLTVGILCYCKLGASVLQILHKNISAWTISDVIIPLGVSYYTFSCIGYLLDIYWRKQKPINNYGKYFLCVSYFPQIVQGPIAKYSRLSDELFKEHPFNFTQVCFGIQLMLYGYFKKLVIADRLALFTDQVFGNISKYEGFLVIIALVFSSFQIYMDFSACMDIVQGMSQIFGIKLENNFNHPFFSKNATEFWRRWHITLGAWYKDYIYLPIVTSGWLAKITAKVKETKGKELAKKVNSAIPPAVVWLLTGLWHGTGWNYIVWGVYWGAITISATIFAKQYRKIADLLHINTTTAAYQYFQMIRTFFIFTIGRLITVPGTLKNTAATIAQIFKCFNPWIFWDGSLYKMGLDYKDLCIVIIGLLFVRKISMLQEKASVRNMIANRNLVLRWFIYYAAFFAIIILGLYGSGYDASDFIYTNF